jgi:AraC-like DNA-binding protein
MRWSLPRNRRAESLVAVALPVAFAAARGAAWEQRQRERLERARGLIDRQYSSELDLDRMAREACLSRYHFLRSFKRQFGDTPHRYLTRRRMERARELLRAGELSVTEVCFEVGFESLGSFSSLFSRVTGESPDTYRRRLWQLGALRAAGSRAVPFCFARAFVPDSAPLGVAADSA